MRSLVALTIYVSLGCVAVRGEDGSWKEVHDRGVAALRQRDCQTAFELFQKSWQLAGTPVERAASANDLGVALFQLTRNREAAQWFGRALAIWKGETTDRLDTVRTSVALASALRDQAEYSAAEQLLRESLAGNAAYRDADPDGEARLLNMLADILREEGKAEVARSLFAEVVRIDGVSWERQIEAHSGLADLDRAARLWNESLAEWSIVRNIAQEHHDAAHESASCEGLGETWLEEGNSARAEPLLRRALALLVNDPVSANRTAPALTALAELHLSENKPALAEEELTRALAEQERTLGPEHPQVAVVLEMLGDAAALGNRAETARGYFGRALRIMTDKFGADSMASGTVFANWALAEQRSGYTGRAALQFERALAILRGAGRDAAALRTLVMERYAEVLKSTHHRKEANALLAEVKSFHER